VKILNYPIFKLLIFLFFGICGGHYYDINLNVLTYFLVGCIVLLVGLVRKKKHASLFIFGFITYLSLFFIGMLITTIHTDKNPNHYSHFYNKGDEITFRIIKELKTSAYYYKYEAKVIAIKEKEVVGTIIFNLKKDSIPVKLPNVDAEYTTKIALKGIFPPLNPHQFNYKKYLSEHGIYHQLQADEKGVKIVSNKVKTIYGYAALFRKKVNKILTKYPYKEEIAVVNALLLGQRQDVSNEIYEAYISAGAVHLLAISGLHIGILFLLLDFILKPLEKIKNGEITKLILIITILWMFAIIAGVSASVVRAVTMFSFIAYARKLNRPKNIYHALITSMFFLLIVNPKYIFDVGFQLSYTAVFGIVWIQPTLISFWNPKNKILIYLWNLLTVSVAAQLSVLPITLYYFHQFPSLFFVSNLVIIPCIGFLLTLGFLLIILAFINALPDFFAEGYFILIRIMNAFVEWIGSKEEFIFTEIHFTSLNFFTVSGLIIALVLLMKNNNKHNFILFSGSLLLCFGSIFYQYKKTENQQRFIIFHKSRNTFMALQKGNQLQANTPLLKENYLFKTYKIGENIHTIEYLKFPSSFSFQQQKIIIIDSSATYNKEETAAILLLTGSPKVNLNRVVSEIKPRVVIADGNNYRSFVSLWKASCKKQKIPFHYTGEKGAFILD